MNPTTGQAHKKAFKTEPRHSAARWGNEGVDVVATPALAGLIEIVCHEMLIPSLREGEASVGTRLDLKHLAAAPIGIEVEVTAVIDKIDGRRYLFETIAEAGGVVLMAGRHGRAIVDFDIVVDGMRKRFPDVA